MNNTITEMKTTLEGINSRITEAEKRISDLEERMVEFTATEQNKEKRMKRNEDSLRDFWDNIKCNNICVTGGPEGEQTEMNNTITELKTTLERINSRITEAEERIRDLEDRMVEFTATEQNKERRMKRNEDSLRDLWDNIKHNNIPIIGVPEGEERERTRENI